MGTPADAKNTAIGSAILAGMAFALIPAIYQAIKYRINRLRLLYKLKKFEDDLDADIAKVPYPMPKYQRDLWEKLFADEPERKFESGVAAANIDGSHGYKEIMDNSLGTKRASAHGFLTDLFSAAKSDWLLASKILLSFVLTDKLARFALNRISKDMIREGKDKVIADFEKMEGKKMKDLVDIMSGKSRIDDYDVDREWLEAERELENWKFIPKSYKESGLELTDQQGVESNVANRRKKSMIKSSGYLKDLYKSILNSDIAAILGNFAMLALTANALEGLRKGFFERYRGGIIDEKLSDVESSFEEAKLTTPEFGLMKLRSIDFGEEVENILKSREKAMKKLESRKGKAKNKSSDDNLTAGLDGKLFKEKDIYQDRFV